MAKRVRAVRGNSTETSLIVAGNRARAGRNFRGNCALSATLGGADNNFKSNIKDYILNVYVMQYVRNDLIKRNNVLTESVPYGSNSGSQETHGGRSIEGVKKSMRKRRRVDDFTDVTQKNNVS